MGDGDWVAFLSYDCVKCQEHIEVELAASDRSFASEGDLIGCRCPVCGHRQATRFAGWQLAEHDDEDPMWGWPMV